MIWGGSKLKTEFGYELTNDHIGECWVISAHKNGDNRIKYGKYQGKTLSWLWDNHRELFGMASGEIFPLLTKIIDAKADLSIQVHPDNSYAKVNENGSMGKTECWYILDCNPNGEIVIGHNARDKKELSEMIHNHRFKELIHTQAIKKGDFFQIEPGTVHAIKAGTLILEIQQNSDVTYRLYDYDRLENGRPRQLHIDKSIDVIRCPNTEFKVDRVYSNYAEYDTELLIHSDLYTVQRVALHGQQDFIQTHKFLNCTVIKGSGEIDGIPIKKGDNFILPYDYGTYQLKGNMELVTSYI